MGEKLLNAEEYATYEKKKSCPVLHGGTNKRNYSRLVMLWVKYNPWKEIYENRIVLVMSLTYSISAALALRLKSRYWSLACDTACSFSTTGLICPGVIKINRSATMALLRVLAGRKYC